jgi:hypothetical protein
MRLWAKIFKGVIEEIQTLVRAELKNEEQEYRQLLIFCLVEI